MIQRTFLAISSPDLGLFGPPDKSFKIRLCAYLDIHYIFCENQKYRFFDQLVARNLLRQISKSQFLGVFSIQNPKIARVGTNFQASYISNRAKFFDSVKRSNSLIIQIS